jgi:hypothetical protein
MSFARTRLAPLVVAGIVGAATLAACGSDETNPTGAPASTSTTPAPHIDPGDGGDYQPDINAADFVRTVDNPFLPLTIGSFWRYEGTSDGVTQTTEVTVTPDRKRILGIDAVVVHDVVKEEGELIEDTYDWFAQDRGGNVWYLGEDSKEYENGRVVSTAGSWEAGVDGAQPGIVMPGAPEVGDAYRQEFYPDEAEDMMLITGKGRALRVPAGSYTGVLATDEWTPLEPDVVEAKFYAPGVGRLLERTKAGGQGQSALVEHRPGA